MLPYKDRQAKIARLRADNAGILATPLMSEGAISATQVNRMSHRERARWSHDAQARMHLEAHIHYLSRTDAELLREEAEEAWKEAASRVLMLSNRIEYLTRLGRGKSGKIRPTYQGEIDKARAELRGLEGG